MRTSSRASLWFRSPGGRRLLATGSILAAVGLAPPHALGQGLPTDVVLRLDRLEEQIRQMTGVIESLQYRNQQLEQQLKRLQESGEPRSQPTSRPAPGPAPNAGGMEPAPPPSAQRRSDAFDPSQSPGAAGAPQTLGTLGARGNAASEPPLPASPGGRAAGAPLDLATLSAAAAREGAPAPNEPPGTSAMLPPPPPRNPNATGAQQTVLAPTATPRDEYDLAYGYVLHKDYALAEEAFRVFLKKYPADRQVSDANFWLGESLFQRQRYRDAAEFFLTVSTKYQLFSEGP